MFGFKKLFKTIKICKDDFFDGKICIIDDFFISIRKDAFEVYNLDGNLVENVEGAFEEIDCHYIQGLEICNNKLILITSYIKLMIIDLS